MVHAHNLFEEGVCLWAAKNAGVPIRIAHSHNTNSLKRKNIILKIREKCTKNRMENGLYFQKLRGIIKLRLFL